MQELSLAVVDNLTAPSYQTPRPQESSARSLPSVNSLDNLVSSLRPFLSEQNDKDSHSIMQTTEQEPNLPKMQVHCGIRGNLWPQIEAIISKISLLQKQLSCQRMKSSLLCQRLEEYQLKINQCQLQIKQLLSQKDQQHQNTQLFSITIRELEQLLRSKEDEVNQKNNIISEIQIIQIKKLAELDDRIKKLTNDQKQTNEKLRKANTDLHRQKAANKELKDEMLQKIEQMQSDKENYLLKEVQKLKACLNSSRGERQLRLAEEISELKRKLYHLTEEVKIKNIQISLMERKKQQAVNDAIQKKQQEVKTQKSLYRSLQEKLARVQQDSRNPKKPDPRQNKLIHSPRKPQEELTFELSPDARQPADIQ